MSAVTGQSTVWARDMAIVGGVTSTVAPMLALPFGATVAFVASTMVAGALSGAALGAAMPELLERLRGRLSLSLLMMLGPLAGLLWGGMVGAVGFAASGLAIPLVLCAGCAALAGALQFGLFWFPYTFQTVRGARCWPVVLGACLLTPVIGMVTLRAALWLLFGPSLF